MIMINKIRINNHYY